MSTIDATRSLLAGDTAWSDYITQVVGKIDLTFADLRGADLRNRILKRCDFTGAQLQGAYFDHAKIESCTFNGANLSEASLVQCELQHADAKGIILLNTVIREASLINVDFTESNISSATITSTKFKNCIFANLHKDGLALSSCSFDACAFNGLHLSRFSLHDCSFSNSALSDWDITDISIQNTIIKASIISRLIAKGGAAKASGFIHCSISELCVGGSNVVCEGLDFSHSTLSRTDLRLIGINSATMLKTALTFCTWPEQRGRITRGGNYTPSPFLLAQPVQDLMGVHPLLRREIADAQYLIHKIQTCGQLGKPFMRLWGLCTGFGQSILRLFFSTLALICVTTIMLLAARGQLFWGKPDFRLLATAVHESFDAFFAFASIPVSPEPAVLAVFIMTHICGFLVLGFWVSIISLKLSRLGGE